MLKVIALDLFGTVFDLSATPREEIKAYLKHVTQPEWAPLELPESWRCLPAYPDAREGIERLKKKYLVVTLSNAPLDLQYDLSEHSGIYFHDYTALEAWRVYKPNPDAYIRVCVECGGPPSEVMMVTGNPTFAHYDYGDCEMARKLGMQAQLIRHGKPDTIIELAEQLGC
jgi:2-haloalkanoic acid dehalogenase type II